MKAKFTQGPPELTINYGLDRFVMEINTFIEVPEELVDQLSLPERVKEYGIKFHKRGNDQ